MKRKIILHGYLKRLHSEPIEVESETIGEAIRSLQNIPALVREDGSPHLVTVDGVSSDIALWSLSKQEVIHIRPRAGGSGGKGGLLQILIGVALIAVAIAFPAGIALGSMTIGTSGFLLTGAMMVLGGIVQMLLPTPEAPGENQVSKYLGTIGNTVQIGTRIPLIYGTRKKGGHYLSFDVDSVEVGSSSGIGRSPQGSTYAPTVSTGVNGMASTAETGFFFEHDKTVLSTPLAPVNPVYASATPTPTGYPISSWGT